MLNVCSVASKMNLAVYLKLSEQNTDGLKGWRLQRKLQELKELKFVLPT